MNSIEKYLENPNRNRLYIGVITVIIGAMLIWSLSAINLANVQESGLSIGLSIIQGILTPDLEFLFDYSSSGVLALLIETAAIAFLGTIIGSILAVPLAFLSASNIVPWPVSTLTRLLLICIRTVPSLVFGLMLIRVTGPGAFTGVMTISLVSIGMLSKLFVDAIEELDSGIMEAMTSVGCTTFEKIRYGIVPQLVSIFMSIIIYRFDMNLREASILGLVGAGGIGAPMIFAMNAYRWNEVGSILVGLIVFILIVELFSNKVRKKLVEG